MMPAAPAMSIRCVSDGPPPPRPPPRPPVDAMRALYAAVAAACAESLAATVAGSAFVSQFSAGRHVTRGGDMRTNLPFTDGNQRLNSTLSLDTGISTTAPVTSLPPVVGLQLCIIVSSVRTR